MFVFVHCLYLHDNHYNFLNNYNPSFNIHSLKRIRRRAGRTIGSASQEFLRVVAEDECGRSLEVVTEWQGTCIYICINVCKIDLT